MLGKRSSVGCGFELLSIKQLSPEKKSRQTSLGVWGQSREILHGSTPSDCQVHRFHLSGS